MFLLCSNRRHHKAHTLQSVQKVCPRFSSAIHLTENTHTHACAPFLNRFYTKAFSLLLLLLLLCQVCYVRFLKSFSLLCPFVSLVFWSLLWSIFFLIFFKFLPKKQLWRRKDTQKHLFGIPLILYYSTFSLLFCV